MCHGTLIHFTGSTSICQYNNENIPVLESQVRPFFRFAVSGVVSENSQKLTESQWNCVLKNCKKSWNYPGKVLGFHFHISVRTVLTVD